MVACNEWKWRFMPNFERLGFRSEWQWQNYLGKGRADFDTVENIFLQTIVLPKDNANIFE